MFAPTKYYTFFDKTTAYQQGEFFNLVGPDAVDHIAGSWHIDPNSGALCPPRNVWETATACSQGIMQALTPWTSNLLSMMTVDLILGRFSWNPIITLAKP